MHRIRQCAPTGGWFGLMLIVALMTPLSIEWMGPLRAEERHVRRSYYRNGVVCSESELNPSGQPHGYTREWTERGELRVESLYHNGAWVWIRTYSPSGELIREITEGQNYLPTVAKPDGLKRAG